MSVSLPASVVVTWPGFETSGTPQADALTSAGLRIEVAPKLGERRPQDVVPIMRDAVAAIVSTDPFDRFVLEACRNLLVIARVGVGTDSIDLAAATELGVIVTTTPGANEREVADHTMALMLAALRRVVEHDASVRRGDWERAGALTPTRLHGAVVGLIGYGTIGREVGKRLTGFDTTLLIYDPVTSPGDGYEVVALEELLERSDVITLHMPLGDKTRGMIGVSEFARMRDGAILVNTARGGVVDEDAMVDALVSGKLGGAGLDVFAVEPPVASPLLEMPNVVLSPHIGGLSRASMAEMTQRAAESVVDVIAGRVPAGAINPEAAVAGRRAHDRR